jgi:hypothetical protein
MRRPALAPSSSCSTTAIVPSRRTNSWVASQLARARGAVGAVLGLQSPAPIALHAASPPCPLAIVPPQWGRGHGNLDFLTCAPATACTRCMWVALHFHPVPPLVLHEAGLPHLPTIAAYHCATMDTCMRGTWISPCALEAACVWGLGGAVPDLHPLPISGWSRQGRGLVTKCEAVRRQRAAGRALGAGDLRSVERGGEVDGVLQWDGAYEHGSNGGGAPGNKSCKLLLLPVLAITTEMPASPNCTEWSPCGCRGQH